MARRTGCCSMSLPSSTPSTGGCSPSSPSRCPSPPRYTLLCVGPVNPQCSRPAERKPGWMRSYLARAMQGRCLWIWINEVWTPYQQAPMPLGSHPYSPYPVQSPNGTIQTPTSGAGGTETDKSTKNKQKTPLKRSKGNLGSLDVVTTKNKRALAKHLSSSSNEGSSQRLEAIEWLAYGDSAEQSSKVARCLGSRHPCDRSIWIL